MREALKYLASVIGAILVFGIAAFGIASDHQSGDFSKAVYLVHDDHGHGTTFYIGHNQFITAAHVTSHVGVGGTLMVRHKGVDFEAVVLWMDDTRDVAMLKLRDERAFAKAPQARLSCDLHNAAIGTPVQSIGFPLEFPTVIHTWGHVASVAFRNSDDGETIQTVDITIAPGNSGGPIFDQTGEVIGMSDALPVTNLPVEGLPKGVPALFALAMIVPRTAICAAIISHVNQTTASN